MDLCFDQSAKARVWYIQLSYWIDSRASNVRRVITSMIIHRKGGESFTKGKKETKSKENKSKTVQARSACSFASSRGIHDDNSIGAKINDKYSYR